MRTAPILALTLSLVSATAQAQVQSSVDRSWQLRLAAGWQDFNGGAEDTTGPVDVELRPSNSIGFELGLARRWDDWEGRVDLGYAQGNFWGESDDLAIKDKTTHSSRLRAAITIARRIVSFEGSRLQLEAGPTFDYWDTETLSDRGSVGGRFGLSLLMPLGGMILENNVSFGISSSPFSENDIPAGAKMKTFTTFTVGAGLRLPL
jgi:opacity protein-like surface antigen